jgi:hypothetical protein
LRYRGSPKVPRCLVPSIFIVALLLVSSLLAIMVLSTPIEAAKTVTRASVGSTVQPSSKAIQTTLTPEPGCFVGNSSSAAWQPVACGHAPLRPLTVGNGNDWVAQSPSGTLIGRATGWFGSTSGLLSENDSQLGAGSYSLQINTQVFTCSSTYTGGKSAQCWEQFVFQNDQGGGATWLSIWYFLIGYGPSCPTTGIPGGTGWYSYYNSCYAYVSSSSPPLEPVSNLIHLSLIADSSTAYDQVTLNDSSTIPTGIWSVTATDSVFNLSQYWQDAEFNVFGLGSGSQANFNSGTSITVNILLTTATGTIQPSCLWNSGTTGETNDLFLGSCYVNPIYWVSFTETLPGVSLSSSSGVAGTSVTIVGTGFIASRSLTVTYDGSTASMPTTCTTDASGNINPGCTFTVPLSVSGPHIVTVSDGTNSPTATFTVIKASPTLTLTLSRSSIVVGQSVYESAALKGSFHAGGTVTYLLYAGSTCSQVSTNPGFIEVVRVTNDIVTNGATLTYEKAGYYGWKASYSGDVNNTGATSPCEPLTVAKASPTLTTTLSHLAILAGQSVTDSATLKGSYHAGGTVTYEYFSGATCSGTPVKVGAAVKVTNSVVPNSASYAFKTAGTYSWEAVYSGGPNNRGATSPCEKLTVLSVTTPASHTTITCTKSSFAVGTMMTCTATVTGSYPSHTGTITWSKASGTGGVTFSSKTCTLSSGKCSVTIKATVRGSVTVKATYSGDPHNPWSYGTIVRTIT